MTARRTFGSEGGCPRTPVGQATHALVNKDSARVPRDSTMRHCQDHGEGCQPEQQRPRHLTLALAATNPSNSRNAVPSALCPHQASRKGSGTRNFEKFSQRETFFSSSPARWAFLVLYRPGLGALYHIPFLAIFIQTTPRKQACGWDLP